MMTNMMHLLVITIFFCEVNVFKHVVIRFKKVGFDAVLMLMLFYSY